MARIPHEVRIFMIHRNAAFESPTAVADAVLKHFGVSVTKQSVEAHDPEKVSGAGLAKKWVDMFRRARAAVLDDLASIGIAHKAVRLRRLEFLYSKAEDMKNYPLAMSILEQAAKEEGEFYSNRRKLEHSSPDGTLAPQPAQVVIDKSIVDEISKMLIG